MQLSQVSAVAVAMAAFFAVSTAAPAPQPPQVEVRQAPLSPAQQQQLIAGMCGAFSDPARTIPCTAKQIAGQQCPTLTESVRQCTNCFSSAAQPCILNNISVFEFLNLQNRGLTNGVPICTAEGPITICMQGILNHLPTGPGTPPGTPPVTAPGTPPVTAPGTAPQ